MKRLTLDAKTGRCEISIGSGIGNIPVIPGRTLVITDRNVAKFHGEKLPGEPLMAMKPGEGSKTLANVHRIYLKMLELELERSSLVVGFGGGIVTDIAGYAATTYGRGIGFGFVPTTLLAQVDAAIGGKNGVNLKGYKNMVGAIRQPKFVICDIDYLKTLPPREMRNGYAEVVKHAAIADERFFAFLEQNAGTLLDPGNGLMEDIVFRSVSVKAGIVTADESESGERMKLNFGHTIGHAVERTAKIPHGQAVSIGMIAECGISVSMGLLKRAEMERLESLLRAIGLPSALEADAAGVIDAMRRDKKRRADVIRMPVLEAIGRSRSGGRDA